MCADTGELVQELRRHIETAEYCATGLDSAVRTLNTVWAQPFGLLLQDVPRLYRAQHDRQLDIMEYLAQNMRVLSAHLDVAAGAYDAGDQMRAEAAFINGQGVPEVLDSENPRPDANTANTSPAAAGGPESDEPVRALLDQPLWLVGDPEPLTRMALAWREAAVELTHLADMLAARSSQGGVWTGAAAVRYGRLCENNVQALHGLAGTAVSLARSMGTCVAILQISHQWAAVMHAGYEDARRGERSRSRVSDQLVSHLAFQRLLAAIMVRLRNAMTGDGTEE